MEFTAHRPALTKEKQKPPIPNRRFFNGASAHNDKLGNPDKIKVFGIRQTTIVNKLEKWRKDSETIFHRAVAEDAGGLAPVKDNNADLWEIGR